MIGNEILQSQILYESYQADSGIRSWENRWLCKHHHFGTEMDCKARTDFRNSGP